MNRLRLKNSANWCLGAMLAVCILLGCKPRRDRADVDLPIYFTCDTQGRLEPCGCFVGQFGGLTRLKTALAAATADSVRVDVGDAVGGREDYDLIQYRYMLRAFGEMKYDALNAGHREARLTLKQLRDFRTRSPVPLLSANLIEKASGKPVLEPYRVIERGGFKIALIGVVDPNGFGELGEGLAIEGMESAITRAVAEVRSKVDLIVLLAFADEEAMARLAQQFYEVQIILGGKVRQPAQELRRENRSWIYFVTNEARALGILKLRLSNSAPPRVTENKVLLLHDKIPQDAGLVELARTYRQEVRRTRLAVDDPSNLSSDMVPGVRASAEFVGTERCVRCHTEAAAVWKSSRHAHAFAALQAREADADPKCIACHTVGFGSPSGYRRELASSRLVEVGCESCHGPGSLHVRKVEGDQSIDFLFRPLDAGDCRKCHYGEFSRPFQWDEFWPAIRHGKEVKAAGGKL